MEPYIVVLLINITIAYLAEHYFEKNKKASYLLISLLVFINTVFSGCRNFGIGIDTTVYIDSYFDYAREMEKIGDFLEFEGDKGFLIIAYISSLFSTESQSLLIFTALFIQSFVYLAIVRYRRIINVNIFYSVLLFCIIYFCHSLNLMRQFCAISLLALAFSYFVEKKYVIYIALQSVAFFFHSSSVIFLMVPFVWWLSSMKNIRTRNLYTFLILIGLLLIIYSFFYFLIYLGDISIVSEVYVDRYGGSGEYVRQNPTSSGGTGLGKLFDILYPLFFICWGYYKKAINGKECYILFVLSALTSLINLLGFQVQFLGRLSFYIGFIFYIFQTKLLASKNISIFIRLFIITH